MVCRCLYSQLFTPGSEILGVCLQLVHQPRARSTQKLGILLAQMRYCLLVSMKNPLPEHHSCADLGCVYTYGAAAAQLQLQQVW